MSHKPATKHLQRMIGMIVIAMLVVMGSLPMILAQATTPTPSAPVTTSASTTPAPTTAVPPSGLKIQIKGSGVDNTQETAFDFLVKNTGSAAISNISVRIYFTPDVSNPASGYVLEKYYDQSGAATISGPTLASGSNYYFTVSYGTASLAAGGQWEFQTALHLSSWASSYSSLNDYYHNGYAVGALPTSYTDTTYIPAYVSGSLVWGTAPGGTATPPPTYTFFPPTTVVPTTTTPSITPSGSLPDLIVKSMSSFATCNGAFVTSVTVSNIGGGTANSFMVSLVGSGVTQTQAVGGLGAGQSTTLNFTGMSGNATATADSTNVVAESNESNNSLTTLLGDSTPGPTCTPTPTALADLVVSSVSAQTNVCTKTVTLQIQISNLGNVAAGSFIVLAAQQNNSANSQSISLTGGANGSVTAGGSVNLTATLTLPSPPVTYVVTADSTNAVPESNENNNTGSVTVSAVTPLPCPTVPTASFTPNNPLPDLVVSSIFYEGSANPCVSAPYDQVTIANNGTGDATGSFQVTFNGLTQTVNGLAAGQSLALKFATIAINGAVATVDSTNVIAESNEGNNSLTASTLPLLTATAVGTTCPTITPTGGALPDLTITAAGSNSPTCTNPNGSSFVTIANIGNANAGTFILRTSPGTDTTVNGLAAGQSTTLTIAWINGSFTATVDATNLITESNENNNTFSVMQPTDTVTPVGGLCTKTLTPTPVTNTPTVTFTPSVTLTPTTPTITLTPTKTNTPNANDPCANATVITGSGSYPVSTSATCFKYVNTTYKFGGMISVMNGSSSTVSNTLKWYGGLDQNVTACTSQSSTLTGNGGQLNNFTVAKDSTGAMYLTVTGNSANTVSISIQNWQNGSGCSVAPTPVGSAGPSNTPSNTPIITNTPVTVTVTKTPSPTPSPTFITGS